MSIYEFLASFNFDVTTFGWILFGLSLIIEISPLKINPWAWIMHKIRQLSGSERQFNIIVEDLKELKEDFVEEKENRSKEYALTLRYRILRFGDEIRHHARHSEEHFNQVLEDIDDYEKYCADHPQFKNNKTVTTISRIKEAYQNCCKQGDFLE